MDLTRSLHGWQNYASASEESEELDKLISDYVKRGFCRIVETEDEAKSELGRLPVLNKLGVVVKFNGDKKKCRVIWDVRESGANIHCSQGERIVLPRFLDLASGAVHKYRRRRTPWLAAVDIRDAFMNIPAGSDKFVTAAAILKDNAGGHQIVIFDTLVFGPVSSPTLWGRIASFLGRSWAAVCPDVSTQIYVDDPAFVLEGTMEEASRSFAAVLLWASVLGFPIKWEKACGGKAITWVGAHLKLVDETSEVEVSIPEDKIQKVQDQTQDFLSRPVIGFRKLRTYAVSLSFIAGLAPHLRPFLTSIWSALSSACTASDGGSFSRTAGKLVHTRRVKPALLWIAALVSGKPAPLKRTLPAWHSEVNAEITTGRKPFWFGRCASNPRPPRGCLRDRHTEVCSGKVQSDQRRLQVQYCLGGLSTLGGIPSMVAKPGLWSIPQTQVQKRQHWCALHAGEWQGKIAGPQCLSKRVCAGPSSTKVQAWVVETHPRHH